MTVKSLVRRLAVLKISHNFFRSFFYVCYALFLLENNLNLFEINVVNASYMFVIVLMEIPTGAFADLVGRRFSVLIAFALEFLGHFIYGFSSSFFWFVMAEMVVAIAFTFFSGAYDAYLIDSLKEASDAPGESFSVLQQKVIAKLKRYENMASLAGGFIGGIIGQYSLRINWFFSSFGALLGFVIMFFFLQENKLIVNKEKRQKLNFWELLKYFWHKVKSDFKKQVMESAVYLWKSKVIFWLSIIGAFWCIGLWGVNMQWIPYFKKSQSMWFIVFSFVLFKLFIIFGNLIAEKTAKYQHKERIVLFVCIVLTGVFVILTSLNIELVLAVMFFYTHEVFRGVYDPVNESYSQSHIPSEIRATVKSLMSMIEHFGSFVGLLLSGWLALSFSINVSWQISGIILILSAFLVVLLPNGILRK